LKVHEYQAKELFVERGLAVPRGEVATTADEAERIAKELGGTVVVKAQVHVGGRGKAGGVKLAKDAAEAKEKAAAILGMDIKGLTVEKVLVTEAVDIADEYYLGLIMDRRSTRSPSTPATAHGRISCVRWPTRSPTMRRS
jgi:succinyl-CoA synthetase beta subunit